MIEKDYVDELKNYIKKNLKKGYTKESLRWALINQGHSKIEVEKAIKKVDEEMASKAPVLNSKPEIKYEVVEPKIKETTNEVKKPWWKKIFGI